MSETTNMLRVAAITGAMVTGAIVATKTPCPEPSTQPLQMIRDLVNDERKALDRERHDLETREIAVRNLTGKPAEVEQTLRELQERNRDLENTVTKLETERKAVPTCVPGEARPHDTALISTPQPLATPSPVPSPVRTVRNEPPDTPTAPRGPTHTSLVLLDLVGTPAPTDAIYPGGLPQSEPQAVTPLPTMAPVFGVIAAGILWRRRSKH